MPEEHNSWEIGGEGASPGAPPPLPSRRTLPLLLGFLVPLLVAGALMGLTAWLVGLNYQTSGVFVGSSFIVIPLLMGIISAYFWKDLKLAVGYFFLNSLLLTALALTGSYFFMQEGVVCLIIVSPVLLTFVYLGGIVGRALFQRVTRLKVSLIPLLLGALVVDATTPHHHNAQVTTRLRIRARPEQVWKHVVAFEPIREKPQFWLFRIGLPRPDRTTADGPFVGARRRCVFSGNLVFEERIVALEPNRRITFDITGQPAHPEILGHATLRRGQMALVDNGDGTTTLIGTSWYSLHVYPAAYYDLWATAIGRNVHTRVMRHIQWVAEHENATAAIPVPLPGRAQAHPRIATDF